MSKMEKVEEFGTREPRQSFSMANFPRDLLEKFMSSNQLSQKSQQNSEEDEDEIELSLGLSLNGRFGVDPRSKLTRSSSIPEFLTNALRKESNNESSSGFPTASVPLVRTSSLPTETEEEWRRRKELQMLRRMEAKRKRSEKQKNLKAARNRVKGSLVEENCDEDKREETSNGNSNEFLPFTLPSWINGGRGSRGIEIKGERGVDLQPQTASQGSNGSPGSGGSLRMSELEGQGTNKSPEVVSPTTIQSTAETEQRQRNTPPAPARLLTQRSESFVGVVKDNLPGNPALGDKGVKQAVRNMLEDMPCVSTTGDGPNGKRIEGFLYRYKKGEEVRIVCVCHGSFLTPAEFIKHAGGGDVAHPLKHIVVNPSPLM